MVIQMGRKTCDGYASTTAQPAATSEVSYRLHAHGVMITPHDPIGPTRLGEVSNGMEFYWCGQVHVKLRYDEAVDRKLLIG
jgi:hypothetical protein